MKRSPLFFASLLVLELASCNQQVQQYPDSVLNSKWGYDAATASYNALGVAIPYVDNKGFEYEVGVDAFGDPTINFYVFYDTDEEAEKAFYDYVDVCAYYGYSGEITTKTYIDYETWTMYQYDSCIVDRVILEHHGIELEFLTSTYKAKPCLGIFGFTYLYIDENEYPLLALEELYGSDASIFPVIDEKGAKYSFQFAIDSYSNTVALSVVVSNINYTIEEWYFNQLLAVSGTKIYQCNNYDDSIYNRVTEYPGFNGDGSYYICQIKDYTVIFEFSLDSYAFMLEFYTIQ